ncbi:MAG: hypothetical protein IKU98_03300 [Bacteroidaceae bacterium]|nr:hypothetical protein [Bacteroidaceae bacterium]
MAKSKSGGTRSFLRGKIGSDVYSVGKDGKGKKQQVVRSLAEVVANPQTEAQMKGRMYMSTVMQAVSAMSVIIDHSFDNVPNGQPSISEFIKQNYALIKADAEAHPASGNKFGLNKYGEKGIKGGSYVVAAGSAVLPAALVAEGGSYEYGLQVDLPSDVTASTLTAAIVKAAFGIGEEDKFTFVSLSMDSTSKEVAFDFCRCSFNPNVSDDTVITQANIGTLIQMEGSKLATLTLSIASNNNNILIAPQLTYGTYVDTQVILSKKENGAYKHNDVKFDTTGKQWNSDAALPTYPTGTVRFLNGGEI